MVENPSDGHERRRAIADAAIRVISRDGVRALTHRAVDREAGIPQGSTSYHAKTRLALMELIVAALADRSLSDADGLASALAPHSPDTAPLGIDALASMLTGLIETLAARRDDMRARYALILELKDPPELLSRLTTRSTVHTTAVQLTTSALRAAGLPHTGTDVADLITLLDGLIFHRTALGDGESTRRIVTAYLRGLRRT